MMQFYLTLSLVTCIAVNLLATETDVPPPLRESIEWCDIRISHANETNHPRVLLIGDSITRDYYPEVERRLAGKAFVARLTTSRFVADLVLLKEIELVLDTAKFDIVHFNNGMHGWQHSEKAYQAAFPKFLRTIQTHAPGAKLVWAATTSLRDGKGVTADPNAEYSDERIADRNAIAAKIMTAQKIPNYDVNIGLRGHPEYHSDNVHFNNQGIQLLATHVSTQVEKLLRP